MKPQRITLSRKRGFNLQAASLVLNGLPAVNCARPSKYGNLHRIGFCPVCGAEHTREEAIAEFEAETNFPDVQQRIREELRGKNLACFCKQKQPCHCDVLLKIANASTTAP